MRHLQPLRPRRRVAAALAALATLATLALSASAASAQQPAVAFTGDVLEITPVRLAGLMAGLQAEEAARPGIDREYAAQLARYQAASDAFPARIAEYEREVAAWQATMRRYEACRKPIEDELVDGAAASADRAQMERTAQQFDTPEFKAQLKARMEGLAARMQAAQQRGDQKAMLALSDSLRTAMSPVAAAGQEGYAVAQRGQARAESAVDEIKRTCGEHPESKRPRSPDSPNELLPKGAWEQLEEAGARAAKLSRRQYAVLKERVGAYLALKKNGPGIAAQYAFAPGERAALDGAYPGLMGHATQLADW